MKTHTITISSQSNEEALKQLAELVSEKGYVEKGYANALVEREGEFPTGLDISNRGYSIAIPHADPDLVNTHGIIIALPEEYVEFKNMNDPDESLSVDLVLLLLVDEEGKHTDFLSNLVSLFQEEEFAEYVKQKNGQKISQKIMSDLDEGVIEDQTTGE